MIINNTHVQGIFIYSQDVEYERGDFLVSGDSIYICTAFNPTNLEHRTVKGIDPAKDSTGNFKAYPGDKVSTAKEYYDYVNNRLSWEFKDTLPEVEIALGIEPGSFPIENVVSSRDALPTASREGDIYKVGTSSTGYEYAYIPYHEDKYISGNVLNEILQNTFFGVNEEGVITNYVTSQGVDDTGNEIIEYSIGGSLANIENGKVLDAIMKSPDLNNGMFNVSRSLSEISTLIDRNSEVESILVKQYTYIDSSIGNKRIRIQELIDPVIGSVVYRWAEGSSVSSSPYITTRVYRLNEVTFFNRKAWISNYDNNSNHVPGEDGYWSEFKGDWAYNTITGWVSSYENSSRVVLKQLNSIKSYYEKKIQELEATRQQLTGTFCNREVDMDMVNQRETDDGVEYDLEARINVRMHSSWQYIRSSERDLLNTLRIGTLSDAISLVSSTNFANTYLNPTMINTNSVIKVGTRTSYTYSYHIAGDRSGWVHGKTLDELLNDFNVSDFSDIFKTTPEEYNTLLELSPDFPYTVIIKDTITGDLSVAKYIQIPQEWVFGDNLLENSGIEQNITTVNYEDVLFNEGLIRSSSSLLHMTANPWLVETGCIEDDAERTIENYCTIAPYITSVSMNGQLEYFLRPGCCYNVEYYDSTTSSRETKDITTDPDGLALLREQDFKYLYDQFDSVSKSLLDGFSNVRESVWNYLSLGPTIYVTDVKYNVGALVFDPNTPGQLYKCIQTSNTPFPPLSDSTCWQPIGTTMEVDNYIPSYKRIFREDDYSLIKDATNFELTTVRFFKKYFHFDAYQNNNVGSAIESTTPTVSPFTGMFCILFPTVEISGEGRHLDFLENEAFDIHNAYYAYFDLNSELCYLTRANNGDVLDVDGNIATLFLRNLCETIFGSPTLPEDDNYLNRLINSSINESNLGDSISNSLSLDCFNQLVSPELGIFVKLCSRSGKGSFYIKTKVYQGVDEYNPVFSNSEVFPKLSPGIITFSNSYLNPPPVSSSMSTWLGLCGLSINEFKGIFVKHVLRSGINSTSNYLYCITDSSLLETFIYRGTDKSLLPGEYYYDNVDPAIDLIFKEGRYYQLEDPTGNLGSYIDPYTEVYSGNPISTINDTRLSNITLPNILTVENEDDLRQVLSSLSPRINIIVTDGTRYYRYGMGTVVDLGTSEPDRESIATYVNNSSILSVINKYYFPTTLIKYTAENPTYPMEYRLAYNRVILRKGNNSWVTGEGPLTQTLETLDQTNMADGLDLTGSDVGLQDLMAYQGLSIRVVCKKIINENTHYYINGNYWAIGNPPEDDSEYPSIIPGDYVFNSYHDLPDAFNLGKIRAKTQEGGEMNWYVVQNTRGWLDINLEEGGQFFDENLGIYVYPWWTDRSEYLNIDEALHDYLHTCFVIHPNDSEWVGIVYEPEKTYYVGDEIVWNSKKWRCLSNCTGEEPADGSDYWIYSGDPIFDALTYIPSETLLISNINPTVPFRLVTKVGSKSNYFVALNTNTSNFGTSCIATFLLEIPIVGTTMIKTHSLTLDLQIDGQYYIDDNTWLSISHEAGDNDKRTVLVHGGTIRNIYYRYRL